MASDSAAAFTPSAPGQAAAINPAAGERYIGTPGAYINPTNGEFMLKIRQTRPSVQPKPPYLKILDRKQLQPVAVLLSFAYY